jgi:hypothetical protein
MLKALAFALIVVSCAGNSNQGSPAQPPANPPPGGSAGSSAADCPATLDCMPPTNDKSALCQLPADALKRRCPNTQVTE